MTTESPRRVITLEEAIEKYGHFDKKEWRYNHTVDNGHFGGDPVIHCWYCTNESLRYENYIYHRTEDLVAGPVGSVCILGFMDDEIVEDIQREVKKLENENRRLNHHAAKFNNLITSAQHGPLTIMSDGMSLSSIETLHHHGLINDKEAQLIEREFRRRSTTAAMPDNIHIKKTLQIARYQLTHPNNESYDDAPLISEDDLDVEKLELLGYIRPPGFVHYCTFGHPSFGGMGVYTYPDIDHIIALGERCVIHPELSEMRQHHFAIDRLLRHNPRQPLDVRLSRELYDLSQVNPVIADTVDQVLNDFQYEVFPKFSRSYYLSEKQQKILDESHRKILKSLHAYHHDPRSPFIPRHYFI